MKKDKTAQVKAASALVKNFYVVPFHWNSFLVIESRTTEVHLVGTSICHFQFGH